MDKNKIYDILKWVGTVVLPALLAFYLTVAHIWGWAYTEPIGATAAAFITLFDTLLGISSVKYHAELKGGK